MLKRKPLVLGVVVIIGLLIIGLNLLQLSLAQTDASVTPNITFAGRAVFQSGDAGGSIENNALLTQKVINLQNTGSNADTFRTTLPVNPETRCGLKSDNASSYPSNVMPNTLPASVDIPLAVNETKYIVAVCVTKGLPAGPFTWSYKTVSVGALNVNRADVNPLIAEVQDTVNITEPIFCNDSDSGTNTSVKGTATGTYAGARSGYIAIYGQEPNPTYPKTTTDKFSTYIDHCATTTQLNEGFCDASGRLQAIGLPCADGCKDGVCLAPPAPPSQPAPSASPIGHWKFDGNGNNEIAGSPAAVIVGNASFKPDGGKMNGYAYIPTGSDWLKIPYNSIFDLPDAFTVEFWFRQRADRSFLQDLVYKGTPINNYNFRIFRQLWNQNNFGPIITGYTAVRTGYWSQTSNSNQLAHGAWHHVAYTKDANGSAYYLDGVLIHRLDTTKYTDYSGSAKTPPADIIIGDSAVDTDIDDLKIYNRALNANEVLQESGFPLPAAPSGLVATAASGGSNVNLSWSDNSSNETGFNIYIKTSGANTWALRATTPKDVTSYPDWNLPAGTHEYKVTASMDTYYSVGVTPTESAPSNIYSVTVSGVSVGITTPSADSTTLPGNNTPPAQNMLPPPPTTTLPAPGTPGFVTQLPLPSAGQQPSGQPAASNGAPGNSTSVSIPLSPFAGEFQCRPYLNGVRAGLAGDKQFWREANWKLNEVKKTYPDAQKVSELLNSAKTAIADIDRTAKRGKCDQASLELVKNQLEKLRGEISAELNSYLFEMKDFAGLVQCRAKFGDLRKETNTMRAIAKDDETKKLIEDFDSRIAQKSREIEQASGEDGFDFQVDCENFIDEMDDAFAAVRTQLNPDLQRSSEKILQQFGTQTDSFLQVLEKSQKKVEELAVQVAELQKNLEGVTKAANELSQQVVVSYQALARIKDKFGEEKANILADKERLISLAGEVTDVLETTGCGKGIDRNRMGEMLGRVATVNWIGDRSDDLEKKLQLIVSACRAKDFKNDDLTAFFAGLDEAQRANLADSCKQGITPFCDVPTHEWYFGGMLTAYENGYMTKGMPGENVLAQDALLMVLRAAGAENITGDCKLKSPEVSKVTPYAICAVNAARKKGLVLQRDMTKSVERIKIAEWISALKPNLPKQADETVDISSFADIRSLGDAKRFVAYMYANGIMVGRASPDGKTRYFEPNAALTRAALAVVLEKLNNLVISQQ